MIPTLAAPLTDSYRSADTGASLVEYTVGGLLAERARTHRGAEALVGQRHRDGAEIRLAYDELFDEACRVATALSRLTQPGDFVALFAPNVVEWPIIQYGAALAGVVLVALNPALTDTELDYALRHSGARVWIYDDRGRDEDFAAKIGASFPDLHVVGLSSSDAWRSDAVDAAVIAAAPADPNLPAMLQYTSGTTGTPKGVLLRHRSLVNVARLTLDAAEVSGGSVMVNPLPMFHTAACVIGTLGPLWAGGTEVLTGRFDPPAVLATMRREQPEVLFFVPAMLSALIAEQRLATAPGPRLSLCLGGASTVSAELIEATEQTFGAAVVNVFGQTELAPVLSATRREDNRHDQLNTVGRPLPQVDCKVVDPITGVVVPVGRPGEICARGYQQMIGYLHDPAATAAAVHDDGFLHTGDLGVMDERGYLTLTGRLKELIIRGGENISPDEVERCLAQHEALAQICVFGLPDERLGELVAAVFVPTGPLAPDVVDQLYRRSAEHLTRHKIPQRWFVADALPTTPTGKVRRFALPDLITQGRLRELFREEHDR